MYSLTAFEEVVLDTTSHSFIRAAFALMPEVAALKWATNGEKVAEAVDLPDGGKIFFHGHRDLGKGFISRTWRNPGGGADDRQGEHLLLAAGKDGNVFCAKVVWPRGHTKADVVGVADRWGDVRDVSTLD